MKKVLSVLALACVLAMGTGCAKQVHKDWFAESGSRADGTVKMAYEFNPQNERPITNQQQALELASQKCQVWGYDHAEPFGGQLSRCSNQVFQPFAGMVCIQMVVEAEFQCIGTPAADGRAVSPTQKSTKK